MVVMMTVKDGSFRFLTFEVLPMHAWLAKNGSSLKVLPPYHWYYT